MPQNTQSVTYTSFENISTISENNYVASFTYNPEAQRAKMVVQQSGNTILTRWYSGSSYTKGTAGGVTKQYTYIGGDAYTAPVVAVKTGTGTPVYYYLLRDYLGSITHVVNTSKTTVAEYSYDAWGRMRNPTNWTNYAPGTEPALFIAGRGFTGHEHMPWFNSINMNGRVYDPLIGQFLSPDNYVQSPDFTQNLNRYSYCFNNPLKYTDPSGYLISASGSRARMGSYLRRHGYSQVDIWMMESDPFMGPTLDYENSGCGGGGGMGYGTSFYETFVRPTQQPDFTSIKKHDGQYGYWVREYVDNNGYIVYPKGLKGDGIVPEISICERFIPITSPSGGEASLAGELFLSGAKGFGVGMEHSPGSIRLSNGSGISPKYYSSGWTGGSRARITTYNLSAWGGRIAKGSIAASAGFGAYHIYNGYQEDGGTYGINAQVATGQAVGGIAGGWGGAMGGAAAGAAICAWFGGVGAVPGAIIGGIIGGIGGGWGGSELGGAAVLQIHR